MKHDGDLAVFQCDENIITYRDIVDSLRAVDAHKCKVLFLHTGISFGIPVKGMKRNRLMEILYDAIEELEVDTLVFPTFTFSFSNRENYDIRNSRTKMGMLNEYARKLPEAVRTMDPLMSFCVIGKNKELANTNGSQCLGKGSFFDNLHHTEDVNICFFGTHLEECFTYQHFVEKELNVPYRYDMDFTGDVIDTEGNISRQTATLFVKYRDVVPCTPPEFEQSLLKKGIYKKVVLGHSHVSCFTEKDAYAETAAWLKKDVNAFLAEPYDSKPLVKEYSFGNVTTVQ
jgi:aminoglycoside 3-N-acetyltransferase